MKRKTKLLKHFLTILHIGAIATPLIVLGFHALNDSLPKFFASQSVQHHGGENDVFSDDLDYANEQLKTRSLDDNLMLTMDSMNYMNYGVQNNPISIEYQYQTNEVNSLDDLVDGNIYLLKISLPPITGTATYYTFNASYLKFFIYDTLFTGSLFIYKTNTNSNSNTFIIEDSNRLVNFGVSYGWSTLGYVPLPFIYDSSVNFTYDTQVTTIVECPHQYIPYTITSTPATNVTSLDDWKEYYNNKNYVQIIDTGVSTHLPINVDFVSLFTQSDIINHDGNIATLLFINFYCNWLINVSMIVFMPEIVMVFFDLVRSIIYKVTDFKEECEV